MQTIRCLLRLPMLILLMLSTYIVVLLARICLFRFPRAWVWMRKILFRIWGQCAARIVGMQIDVERLRPQAPYFLVGNHLSYLDIVLLGSQLDAVFVAKHEMARWPVFGTLARFVDTIFIERENRLDTLRVNRHIQNALEAGQGVILFPEGWVSKGETVMAFHPPLLEPAVRLQIPVHYFSIHYETKSKSAPAAESICWDSGTSIYPHLLDLMKQPGFHARLTFGPEPILADDRKVLALQLHDAVHTQFIPLAQAGSQRAQNTSDPMIDTQVAS